VARAAFEPNDEQKKLLVALKRAATKAAEADTAYRAALAAAAESGVPVARLAADLDVERKTVYRHLGRTMQ
jgi:transcriptional regulator of acetoin/glycerol metabolism